MAKGKAPAVKNIVLARINLIELKSSIPQAFTILELWGFSNANVAALIKRSPHQVTYYRNGTTPVPKEVNRRLLRLMVDCYDHSAGHSHRLVMALRRHTQEVIEHYGEKYDLR